MTRISATVILSQSQMFENLTRTQLELVASICEPLELSHGVVLFGQNDASNDMYVIGRGAVEIVLDPTTLDADTSVDPVILTELHQGQVLGEIALVDRGLRTALARVSQNKTQLLRISRDRLLMLCDTYPELGYKIMRNLAGELALKIRRTDLTIHQYHLLLA